MKNQKQVTVIYDTKAAEQVRRIIGDGIEYLVLHENWYSCRLKPYVAIEKVIELANEAESNPGRIRLYTEDGREIVRSAERVELLGMLYPTVTKTEIEEILKRVRMKKMDLLKVKTNLFGFMGVDA